MFCDVLFLVCVLLSSVVVLLFAVLWCFFGFGLVCCVFAVLRFVLRRRGGCDFVCSPHTLAWPQPHDARVTTACPRSERRREGEKRASSGHEETRLASSSSPFWGPPPAHIRGAAGDDSFPPFPRAVHPFCVSRAATRRRRLPSASDNSLTVARATEWRPRRAHTTQPCNTPPAAPPPPPARPRCARRTRPRSACARADPRFGGLSLARRRIAYGAGASTNSEGAVAPPEPDWAGHAAVARRRGAVPAAFVDGAVKRDRSIEFDQIERDRASEIDRDRSIDRSIDRSLPLRVRSRPASASGSSLSFLCSSVPAPLDRSRH